MRQTALDEFLEAISSVPATGQGACSDTVWKLTAEFFRGRGFDRLIYMDVRLGSSRMHTTLPKEWVRHYQDSGYDRIDPFFTYCCPTYTPIGTGIDYCDNYNYLSAVEKRLIGEASDFGFRAGFSSIIRRSGPTGFTGFNIGSSLSASEVDSLRAGMEAELRLASVYAHDWLERSAQDRAMAALSSRERTCLSLLAEGQRTKDIAQSLGLSTAAIELYLRNARRKLGASTREQAVAIAWSQGFATREWDSDPALPGGDRFG